MNKSFLSQNKWIVEAQVTLLQSKWIIEAQVTLSQNKWIVEAQVTTIKSYVKCEISSVNNKTESLFDGLNKIFSTEEIQH